MSILICPVCKEKLNKCGNLFRCSNNHSFDCAKEGYVNLLLGSKSGDKTGDSKDSARARHNFLDKGYYDCIAKQKSNKIRFSFAILPKYCVKKPRHTQSIPAFFALSLNKIAKSKLHST